MEKRRLGKTGFDVSVLGFGCAPASFLKYDPASAGKLIEGLLDTGINLVDTATSYPGSEEFIGNFLSHRRDDFVLVSKVGNRTPGCDAAAWSPALITFAVDRALKLMKTDHIDVMLLHSCDLATLQADDALEALVSARDAGKIKFAGYSGDNEAAAFAARLPDVAVIETSINIVDQVNIDMVLPVAQKHDVGVIAKRPIFNAAWKDLATQKGLYKTYAAEYTKRLSALGVAPIDVGFDDWPELALRFTLSQPGLTTAIVGTTNPINASANATAAGKGALDDETISYLREAFRRANADGQWVGQT